MFHSLHTGEKKHTANDGGPAREETEKLFLRARGEKINFPPSWDDKKIRLAVAACLREHKGKQKKTHGNSLASHSSYDIAGALQQMVDQFGVKKTAHKGKRDVDVTIEEEKEEGAGIGEEEEEEGKWEGEWEWEGEGDSDKVKVVNGVALMEINQDLHDCIKEMAHFLQCFLFEVDKAAIFYRDAEIIRNCSHWIGTFKDALKEGITKEVCILVDEYQQSGGNIKKLDEWRAEFSE